MLRAGPAQAGKRRALGQDLDALSECELWHQALRHLQAARRKAGAARAPRAPGRPAALALRCAAQAAAGPAPCRYSCASGPHRSPGPPATYGPRCCRPPGPHGTCVPSACPRKRAAGQTKSRPGAASGARACRHAGTSEPAAAAALAGLRREVQVVMAELCTMAAVAQPLQLLPQALACLQGGQLQFIFQPQACRGPGRHVRPRACYVVTRGHRPARARLAN